MPSYRLSCQTVPAIVPTATTPTSKSRLFSPLRTSTPSVCPFTLSAIGTTLTRRVPLAFFANA